MNLRLIPVLVICGTALWAGVSGAAVQTGDAVQWGEEVIPLVQPGIRFKAIAVGRHHNLALKPGDGTVVAWGDNSWGYPLGQCSVLTGLSDVVGIAAGDYHSLAVKRDGTVAAW